jgi:hypothetical protein
MSLLGLILLISCGSRPQTVTEENDGMKLRNMVLTRPSRSISMLAEEAVIPYPAAPSKSLPTVPPIKTPQIPMQNYPVPPAIIRQPRPILARPQRESAAEPEKPLRSEREPAARDDTAAPAYSQPAAGAAVQPSVPAKPRPIPQPEASPPPPILESIADVTLKSVQPAAPPKIEPPPPPAAAEPAVLFDPQSISRETFNATKAEVEAVIKTLNSINQRKDYQAWLKYLDAGYREKLSSPEFLENQSKQPRLASQKIVLSSLRDYFMHVFIPARMNARVDTIEFDDHKKVKVIAINRRRIRPPADPKELERIQPNIVERTRDGWLILNERVLYYELEKNDNGWKIIDFIN